MVPDKNQKTEQLENRAIVQKRKPYVTFTNSRKRNNIREKGVFL